MLLHIRVNGVSYLLLCYVYYVEILRSFITSSWGRQHAQRRGVAAVSRPHRSPRTGIYSQVLNESEDPIVLRVTDVGPVVKRTRKVSYQRTL